MPDLLEPLLVAVPFATAYDSLRYHLQAFQGLDRRFTYDLAEGSDNTTCALRLRYSRRGGSWHEHESLLGTLRVRSISPEKTSIRFDESSWRSAAPDELLERWSWYDEWDATDAQRREMARQAIELFRNASATLRQHILDGLRIDHILTSPSYGLQKPAQAPPFVDPMRVSELAKLSSTHFDFQKLVRLCEELNACHAAGCYFAVAMLARSILDHVPPVFGASSFSVVANNVAARSTRRSFQTLEKSSRNIADAALHSQIRSSEVLPTQAQVNFSADLDVLLSEVVRLTR